MPSGQGMASTAGKIIHFPSTKELNFPDACQPHIIYLNLAQRQSQKCGVESSHGAFCGGFKLCLLFSVEIFMDPPRVTRCVFPHYFIIFPHYFIISSHVATNIHLAALWRSPCKFPRIVFGRGGRCPEKIQWDCHDRFMW